MEGKATEAAPLTFQLKQNQPNPFNGTTWIDYYVPAGGAVQVEVFNTLGQLQARLVNQHRQAGWHSVAWAGESHGGHPLASGTYVYVLTAPGVRLARPMTLVK